MKARRNSQLSQEPVEPHLLRGVPLTVCLSGWAKHFRPPASGILQNDQESYNLSQPTEGFDEFLSHDWETPRLHKLLTMLIIYNSRAAFVCSFCFSVLVGFLRAVKVLPDGLGTELVAYAVFPLVLCFWQRLRSLFTKPITVFFDMLCVNQHDEELKRKAISGLVSFLDSSKKLTIFWSKRYFSRLWCTYEISTFLRDPQMRRTILVMPVKLSVILVVFSIFEHMISFAHFLITEIYPDLSHLQELALFLPFLALNPLLYFIGIGMMSDLQKLPRQLQEFRVQDAECACCSKNHRHPETGETLACDREIIFRMLKRWFGKEDDLGDEHLETFNSLVHEVLAPRVLQSMGSDVLPFSYCVYMILVSKIPELCHLIPVLAAGPGAHENFNTFHWALRKIFTWAMGCVTSLFWVRMSMRGWLLSVWCMPETGLDRAVVQSVSAFLISIPIGTWLCMLVLSYHGILIYTAEDNLTVAAPFVFWVMILTIFWNRQGKEPTVPKSFQEAREFVRSASNLSVSDEKSVSEIIGVPERV
ncbi:Uncharacterized protein SCF082_LOCUS20496 [Durusdinium trenchii]|uniref:Transmembrane protein n=3 Tax=Durusdinium trenchii TaxID=1381693 RepID=A0ABP0L4D3_9DINO